MDEIIKKANELKALLKENNVLSCEIKKDDVRVLVRSFADIPSGEEVNYRMLRGEHTDGYVEKFVNVEEVKLYTYGTKKEMLEELEGAAQ
jgi:hypothetical protein